MRTTLLRFSIVSLAILAAACSSSASLSQDTKPEASLVNTQQAADPQIVDLTISLTGELVVDVQMWLSGPLADGNRTVRVVYLCADNDVGRMWVNRATVFGPIDARGSEPLDASTGSVSIGLARSMAAQVLGQGQVGEFAADRVGPFLGAVRPVEGKTWGEVVSESDLDITFRQR